MAHLAGEPAFGGAEPAAGLCPSVEVAAVVLGGLELLLHGAHKPQVLLTSLYAHQGGARGHLERQGHHRALATYPKTHHCLAPSPLNAMALKDPAPWGPSRALRLGGLNPAPWGPSRALRLEGLNPAPWSPSRALRLGVLDPAPWSPSRALRSGGQSSHPP